MQRPSSNDQIQPAGDFRQPENDALVRDVHEAAENLGGAALATVETSPKTLRVEVPDGILTTTEVDKWGNEHGFKHKTRGTYHTPGKEAFLYIKGCLGLETDEDVEPALAVVRHMTSLGILHPDTQWGAFKRNDKDFQLFPVSPGINPADLEALVSQPERFTTLRKTIDDEDSQILAWVRRLDPEYPASLVDGRPSEDSLVNLLNLHEASHPDNWGYDDTGKFYPVDVEVINLRYKMDLVHRWYEKQKLPQ